MPSARRIYTWVIRWNDPLMAGEVAEQVAAVAETWCRVRPRRGSGQSGTGWRAGYGTPRVTGGALGVLSVSIVIQARDQWEVHRRACRFAAAVAAAARVKLIHLGDPVPEKLPPHTNRGHNRVRAVS